MAVRGHASQRAIHGPPPAGPDPSNAPMLGLMKGGESRAKEKGKKKNGDVALLRFSFLVF
jgi:hypothetical protein